ncbi:hypothetical protein DSM112329_01925 [Paraconexibacter sp. AEG42_29]|uniref:Xanthine/uracil/vitamin C permease n=1 Tax=Paraconexibacter sp. AEG42_29 TaxID=2997339 RepID=A0AAU7AUD0_9ACTN
MSTPALSPPTIPFWTRGDLNAFFGLFVNMLVNVLVLSGLVLFVVNIPAGDVSGVILPALGIELLIGNVFYFYLAKRLAAKTGRTDVTALPYGPSVPHMFIVTLVIMLPVYLQTKDPIQAWAAGVAWAFIIGVIILLGAFVGPYVRRLTPRAAMLGMLAGISVTFISMRPAAQMWEATWIALPVLTVIIIGFVSGVRLPGNVPIGLAALLLGSAIGWAGGYMSAPDVETAAKEIGVGLPGLEFGLLMDGLKEISPLLATAIPLGIYNFTEAMSNVESASAAGDDYDLRAVLLADGTGACVGAAMGCPFPPAVYIGHPGWKDAGGRVAYSLATGVLIFALCVLGMFPLLSALLPIPAIVPVLLYIGLVIGAQAFKAVPRAHYPAIVIAMIPNIAAWGYGLVDSTLSAAGTNVDKVGADALTNAGVIFPGLNTLGQGAVLAGMVLGAIAVFLIDRRFVQAAAFCFIGGALASVGLIHGAEVDLFEAPKVGLGYALSGVVCLGFHLLKVPERERDPTDPMDVDDELAEAIESGKVPAAVKTPEPVAVPA